jgi:hypothetical protein
MKYTHSSQNDIDVGYIFGRSFNFILLMAKVKPPKFETTFIRQREC